MIEYIYIYTCMFNYSSILYHHYTVNEDGCGIIEFCDILA